MHWQEYVESHWDWETKNHTYEHRDVIGRRRFL